MYKHDNNEDISRQTAIKEKKRASFFGKPWYLYPGTQVWYLPQRIRSTSLRPGYRAAPWQIRSAILKGDKIMRKLVLDALQLTTSSLTPSVCPSHIVCSASPRLLDLQRFPSSSPKPPIIDSTFAQAMITGHVIALTNI